MITSHDDQPDDPEAAADRSDNPPGAVMFAGHDDPCKTTLQPGVWEYIDERVDGTKIKLYVYGDQAVDVAIRIDPDPEEGWVGHNAVYPLTMLRKGEDDDH